MLKTVVLVASAVITGMSACTFAKTISRPPQLNPDFALKLYRQVNGDAGNVFVSPISIQSALAMAAEGAKGETRQQILDTLAVENPAVLAGLLERLQKDPQKDDPSLQLRIANGLWGQRAYPFEPEFVTSVKKQFGAEARELDFQQAEVARGEINKWVEDKTNDKIKNLLPDGAITPDTRLILTNAVYFKADWQEKFDENATADAKFHVGAGKTTTARMMHLSDRLGYFDAGSAHAVRLPYVGSSTSMLLLVPKAVDGIAETEKALTPQLLEKIDHETIQRQVQLSLPRFEFEDSTTLGDVLKKMGMEFAFDAEKADFSTMTTSERLSISDVIHKTYVKVDENGTEAAGATAVLMKAMSMPLPEQPVVVTADRPFLILIRDDATGAVLFIGRVTNPAA